jgi:nucleoside-diphosphate-sugar epimerase
LNFGSAFEYGQINANLVIDEYTKPSPDDIYGASKLANFIMLSSLAKLSPVKLITFRPFSLFGKFEKSYRLFPQILKAGFLNNPIKLTKGEQLRDYLFVEDLVLIIHETILKSDNNMPSLINICSGNHISIRQFIDLIIELNHFSPSLFQFGELSYRPNESMKYLGSNKLLLSVIPNLRFTKIKEAILASSNFYK